LGKGARPGKKTPDARNPWTSVLIGVKNAKTRNRSTYKHRMASVRGYFGWEKGDQMLMRGGERFLGDEVKGGRGGNRSHEQGGKRRTLEKGYTGPWTDRIAKEIQTLDATRKLSSTGPILEEQSGEIQSPKVGGRGGWFKGVKPTNRVGFADC